MAGVARGDHRQGRSAAGTRPAEHLFLSARQRPGLELRAGNYLKGQKPQAFDLLYWNSDSTNLPGPFACWYMRNLYLDNNLRVPGKLEMCGQRIDLAR
jgi:hypothetical protein